MKIRIMTTMMLLMFCAMSFAAKTDNVYSEETTSITLTSEQPEFILKLKSNPTTGYSWFLRDYPANLITPVKHYFQSPDNGLIGAPGFEFWVFRVKPAAFTVPQQFGVKMIYARPWGKESGAEVDFKVNTQ